MCWTASPYQLPTVMCYAQSMKWIHSTRSNPIQVHKPRSESSSIHVEQAGSKPIQSSPEMLCIWGFESLYDDFQCTRIERLPANLTVICVTILFSFQKIHSWHNTYFFLNPVQSIIHHICNILFQSNPNPSGLDWISNPLDWSKPFHILATLRFFS